MNMYVDKIKPIQYYKCLNLSWMCVCVYVLSDGEEMYVTYILEYFWQYIVSYKFDNFAIQFHNIIIFS
jgi:hypothetical protein